MRIPTLKQVIKEYLRRIKCGFHDVEAFEDVVEDLLNLMRYQQKKLIELKKSHDKLTKKEKRGE